MSTAGVEIDSFGVTADGTVVERFRLRNAAGMAVGIVGFGATVTELLIPDRHGRLDDVVLGFDTLDAYETQPLYCGCMVGRVAFRIADAAFVLDGRRIQLTRNAGRHHVHGGTRGLSRVVWQGEVSANSPSPAVTFRCRSVAGDEGYPGTLDVAVRYTLTADHCLRIDSSATTDQATPVNLTHHGYFNLAGHAAGDVLGHWLMLDADRRALTDADLIPTGELADVAGTPFDFSRSTRIGARIEEAGGYDLAYERSRRDDTLALVATLDEPLSGRRMEVLTTAPALVLYTGNALDGGLRGKHEAAYPRHAGLCLETGHLPDAVNHAGFASMILRPGETYRHTCVYRFGVTTS